MGDMGMGGILGMGDMGMGVYWGYREVIHAYALFIFSFTYIYTSLFMAAPTPTPTPTLTLPQIQFLNHFLYSKPPSFRNPNTLFRALQKPPHFYTFNLLHLSFPLITLYTRRGFGKLKPNKPYIMYIRTQTFRIYSLKQ